MSRSILIIDDESSILSSLSGALKDEGYRTKTALSGEEGILSIRTERPDVVMLDIWMRRSVVSRLNGRIKP
jgi:two-component system nitrogen regulation response regulator NtrX